VAGPRGTLEFNMPIPVRLFDNNAAWAARQVESDPEFFARLQRQQAPEYLWIGCSDSRVPANEIVGLAPGELFVHRNVANVVVHTDLNCLSVVQYAVDVLGVQHVIVTGHYGCGGVRAAFDGQRLGLIDNWLRHVEEVRRQHEHALNQLTRDAAIDRLCELNVIEQARHVCETTIVQDAWARGHSVTVHGWIYGLKDGRLQDVGFAATRQADVDGVYQQAVQGSLAKTSAGQSA
jgi:carbonic anhydrase